MLPSTSIRFGRPMGVSSGSVAFKKAKQAFTSSQHWAALSARCVRPIGKRAILTRCSGILGASRGRPMEGYLRILTAQARTSLLPLFFSSRSTRKNLADSRRRKVQALLPMGLTHPALNAAQCWDDVNACFAFLNATEPDETPIGRPNRIEVDGSILRQPNRFLGPYELHVYAEVRSCSAVPRKG